MASRRAGHLLVSRAEASRGIIHHLATPHALTWTLLYTTLMSAIAAIFLLRSSLPGGRGVLVPRTEQYRSPGILPEANHNLLALIPWLTGSLLSWMAMVILVGVAPLTVGVEGDREAVRLEIALQRFEVGRGALARHGAQLHQPAGGIVDEDQQRAGFATAFEPTMLAAVD